MSKFLRKSLIFSLSSRFCFEKPLFSSLFAQIPSKTPTNSDDFLEISLKTPENLTLSLSSQPQLLRNLSFTEKMLIFERFHASRKAYSLEFVELLMEELLAPRETRDFCANFCEFLDKTRQISLKSAFPEPFLAKLLGKVEDLLLAPEEIALKWRIIGKLASFSSDFAENCAQSRVFLDFLEQQLGVSQQSRENLRICVKFLGKSREVRLNSRFLALLLGKIQEFLFKDWDSYADILKILSKCENLPISSEFSRSLQEFLLAELEDFPKNGVFLLKQLNFLLYKLEKRGEKCEISPQNKGNLLRNLRKHASLGHCEAVLLIFMKTFREDLSGFREILAQILEISWENESISSKISVFSTIARLFREDPWKRDKKLKNQGIRVFLRVFQEIRETPENQLKCLESRDFARLFNAFPLISQEKEQISWICQENFEGLLGFLKKNSFKFPTLLNILRVFSENGQGNKHFYVVLEEKLMENIEEMLNVLQRKDLILIKKCFRNAGYGSRKLYNFLENAIDDTSPGNVTQCWRDYKRRESKYLDFKEKRRKSLFYERLRRGNSGENQ